MKKLLPLLQLLLGLGLILYLLFGLSDREALLEALRAGADNWPLALAGAGLFGLCLGAASLRWRLLLGAQGINITFRHALALYFIGHFFNAFFLGATGGDVVKAFYAAREAPDRRTEVVSTIFIDRLIGLLSLLLLAVAVMSIRLPFFLAYRETRWALAYNVVLLGAALLGLALVFRRNLFEKWALFRRIEQRTALGKVLARAYQAFRFCLGHRGLLLQTGALSLVNHMVLIMSIFVLGSALGIPVPFSYYLTVCPTLNSVSAIPLTPGGLGTREAAAVFLMGVADVPPARAITLSLLLYASLLAWSLIGGLVYLFFCITRGKPVLDTGPAAPEPAHTRNGGAPIQ